MHVKNMPFGDDRLRRERLVPKCEPSAHRTRKISANFKCQPHFIRRYAPRRLITVKA